MITQDLATLKIHKLTQEQYDRVLAEGTLDPNALYLTPDEESGSGDIDVNTVELITVDDIDAICGATIEYASLNEVTF